MQHSNSLQVSFVLLSKVIKSVIGLQFCWSVFKIVEYNSTRKSVSTCSMSVDTEAPPTLLCSAACPVAGSFCQLKGNSVLLTPAYAVPCTITLVRPFQARATWSSSAYSPWKRHIICVHCNWWWKELVHVSCTSSIKLVSHCCCNQSADWSHGWEGKEFTQYMNCFS